MSHGLISVVVPARDAAATIDAQLEALAAQEVEGPWEVVVSDNGSSDATADRARAWASRLPALRVVDASARRGAAHARNVGVGAAQGDRILMCDADDVVGPGWVHHLAAALCTHEMASGFLDTTELNSDYHEWWRTGWVRVTGLRIGYGYLPFVATGTMAFRRAVFDAVGGFDVDLRRGEDMDFSWRAARTGVEVRLVHEAVVGIRLPTSRLGLARQGFSDGVCGPQLYVRHRAHGMRREPTRDTLHTYGWLLRHVRDLRHDGSTARRWSYEASARLGRLVGSARERTVYL